MLPNKPPAVVPRAHRRDVPSRIVRLLVAVSLFVTLLAAWPAAAMSDSPAAPASPPLANSDVPAGATRFVRSSDTPGRLVKCAAVETEEVREEEAREEEARESASAPPLNVPGHDLLSPDVPSACGLPRAVDQLWVVSTRRLGAPNCHDPWSELEVLRYDPHAGWQASDVASLFAAQREVGMTHIYVHGNRVSNTDALRQGRGLYRRMVRGTQPIVPLSFIIWSWPSTQIQGQLRDVRVKAQRTNLDGYYLGWFLARLDGDRPLSVLGYSFGARIITGALHLRAGGMLAGRVLPPPDTYPPSPETAPTGALHVAPPTHVVMLAPALHQHWLAPGYPHELAAGQMDRLLLLFNSCDRVLKRYGLLEKGGHPEALGYTGLTYSTELPWNAIEQWDACPAVGKPHDEQRYYQAAGLIHRIRQHMLWREEARQLVAADEES